MKNLKTYSATCLRVLDCSALYEDVMQNASPKEEITVSRYNCDDWVR